MGQVDAGCWPVQWITCEKEQGMVEKREGKKRIWKNEGMGSNLRQLGGKKKDTVSSKC